ncbi:MAG: alpha-keto acid decarboxylase family protein [Legionellaceae bacterium]|nr:alpha-keto acid decarboxylase family protein [Legionellaceae bacterium]
MSKLSISNYLLQRLVELGIEDIFGVPGDYNLSFLDQIVQYKNLRWVGNCNELNAAYAADGYARVRGAAALVTTFGVGELSAINGIAGSYAEFVPVVNIVGAPSTTIQQSGALMHHTLGTSRFDVFMTMFEKVSAAVVILDSAENAGERIDSALETCWIKKQPVYISIPSDMVLVEIDAPKKPLCLNYPPSDPDVVNELIARINLIIRKAKSPVILADLCAVRHSMKALIHELLDKTGIPFATMNMGKGIIDESHANFLGMYNGLYSSPGVKERVEHADCILSFGSLLSDFNTGGFTTDMKVNSTIEIHSNYVKIRHSSYPSVYFNAVIPALIHALHGYQHKEKIARIPQVVASPSKSHITQAWFWAKMGSFFKSHDIIIAETGTSMFGLLETAVPDHSTVIAQTLWASIGYSVGAILGAALADQTRRTILFVGDGSFQLTAQEISTVMRHHLSPIVFLLNNDGYTIERVIHGPNMSYNDIQPWQYAKLPTIFGDNVFSCVVETAQDLDHAINKIDEHRDKLCFIEVKMKRDDCPDNLRELGRACELKNER